MMDLGLAIRQSSFGGPQLQPDRSLCGLERTLRLLASIFSRSDSGFPELNAPILWKIDSDAALTGTRLIAEALDSGTLYQVGS
jgi:hypothetical protein